MKCFLLDSMAVRLVMRSGLTKALVTAIVALQLVACGGGSSGESTAPTTNTGAESNSSSTISDDESTVPDTSTGDISTVSVTTSSNGSIAPEIINTGSVSLRWAAPVTRTDGTPLSLVDIGGFYIYYGKSEGSYPNRVNLDDETAQAVTLNSIPVGTYYMVMTTYDVNGRESGFSSVVEKTVL